MSSTEERLLILKMLEDGKITSEEAAKLLEALEGNAKQPSSQENTSRQSKQQNFNDEINKVRERIGEWKKDIKKSYNQTDFDRMVDEFGQKAEKLGKNVAYTTFGVVDKVVDFVSSFVDTNSFNMFANYKVFDRSFEALAQKGMNLNVEGLHGHITVKKHAGDKILIHSKVRSPIDNADQVLNFSSSEGEVLLRINKVGHVSVSHDIFLPEVKFNSIHLETVNSKIYAEDSNSETFEAITRNSHIELMGVGSEKITVRTKNAKIQLSYVTGRDINIHTEHSVIDVKHIKSVNLNAITMNGRILVENAQNYENEDTMHLYLRTTNGGIRVNMNDQENRGYSVRAQTANGGVNLLIPDLTYKNVGKNGTLGTMAEAESNGYEGYVQKVRLDCQTVNGYIEIVK